MVIESMGLIPKQDKETEYEPIKDQDHVVLIKRYQIGLEFEVTLSFDEYCWVFGDKHPDKFNKHFDEALYEFIRDELMNEGFNEEE